MDVKGQIKSAASQAFKTPISKITDQSSFIADMVEWSELRAALFLFLIEEKCGVVLSSWEEVGTSTVAALAEKVSSRVRL